MDWFAALTRVRAERRPAVLVTLTSVRGHAPRAAGAKMVVTADEVYDSIGGGNLEESAVADARALLDTGRPAAPVQRTFSLSDKAPAQHGVQCCGGEVQVLLEPLAVRPAVAIFGVGHVGLELARVLARHDLDLHLVDSRTAQLEPARLAPLDDAVATVRVHRAPVPEVVLGEVPPGCHVLVMTHDHAEDLAICDAALRCGHLGTIGLIGSSAKWSRFRKRLAAEGHSDSAIERITTPIGLPDLPGKEPAVIAVGVAADLLRTLAPATATPAADTQEATR
ncbi:xanthine dehydrogenase accessory protein XdhC [Luteipulveratus halotolerans]|uniref:Molybdenum cofactor sulfurylase n=1 Tax=Luteipulveratus halotolerans TaxID=1631356 RepID=A0A0L6CEN0_9MICO|nr:xanthine dehydrogenase accessory protein XdhC [Luteipulveratus halotolerans]KNX36025.1 molybdenum cofactor sulfurylase [Luteipulveratus halotolerans]